MLSGRAVGEEVNYGSRACWASGSESVVLCVPMFLSLLLLLLFVSFGVLLTCRYPDP